MKKIVSSLVLALLIVTVTVPFSYANSTSNAVTITTSAVTIVSPATNVIYTKDLLLSLRVSEQTNVKLSVYKATDLETPILGPVTYENTSNLNFYTKTIPNIKPGIYRIVVLDLSNSIETKCDVTVKEKPASAPNKIFNAPTQNSALQIIQTVFKSIFGGQEK